MDSARTGAERAAYIQAENATFRGPNGPVFKDCTLTIAPGERWAVVGPNGSGKGLLLAALMGKLGLLAGRLRHPFLEGDARFADSVFGVLPPGTLALASMAEHRQWLLARDYHQLRWHASMSQGLATVSQLLERNQVENRNPFAVLDPANDRGFEEARRREITRFELGPLLDRPLVALSNGELHRFVLARALLRQPRLLLIDDPIAGLDAHSRQRLHAILDELDAEGIGVILATERESDLPDGITHLLQLQKATIQSAGPRTQVPGLSARSSPARAFVMPKVQRRPLPEGVPMLEMTNATVRQGSVTLLDGISLRVEQGEHWALLGPNGSGKSTLLSLILADNPLVYANDVRVAGQSLGPGRSIWDQKAWMGWLSPELEAHYPPHARTFEVVLSGFDHSLGVHGHHSPEQIAAATAWLGHMGLHQYRDTAFAEIRPEARRLALLARAAVHGPALLLLDEPCQGLDAEGRSTVQAAIAAVAEALSAAMIYVTHDPEEIPASVTQVLVLDQGRVRYRGPRRR
jgi:molybdate transport system ATP-binding protein